MSGHDEQRQPLMDDGGVGGIDDRDRGPSRRHASAAAGASVAEQVGLANGRRKPLKAGEKMWYVARTQSEADPAFSSCSTNSALESHPLVARSGSLPLHHSLPFSPSRRNSSF